MDFAQNVALGALNTVVRTAYPVLEPMVDEQLVEFGELAGREITDLVNGTATPVDNEAAEKLALFLEATAASIREGLGSA